MCVPVHAYVVYARPSVLVCACVCLRSQSKAGYANTYFVLHRSRVRLVLPGMASMVEGHMISSLGPLSHSRTQS